MTHDGANHKPLAPENAEDVDRDPNPTQASRKERVLHTRVPAVLEQELRRLAESWRVPVSNVVRAILEDAVTAVDKVGQMAEHETSLVVGRLAQRRKKVVSHVKDRVASRAASDDDREPVQAAASPETDVGERIDARAGILGYQPIILASDCRCSHCSRQLHCGEEVFLGLRDGAGPRLLVGRECLPEIQHPKHPKGENP